jgi:hypothetical protein
MLSYQTSIPVTPPVTDEMKRGALAALTAMPPGWAGQNRGDVFAAAAQQKALEYDQATANANADFVTKARDLQSQMGLRGAQQMAQAYGQGDDLALQRQRNALDRSSQYLSGVNSILRGLFQ